MKKVLALILALAMMCGLMTGCGGSNNADTGSSKKGAATPVVQVEPGTYPATYCAIEGTQYAFDEDWLEIESDGTGILMFEGEEYTMEWKLQGSVFTFEDEEGSTFEGTYDNGTIVGILDGSIEYIFQMEAAQTEAPKKGQSATAAAGSDFEPVSGVLNGYEIAVVGAELFTDTDDKDGIRVYWDFTNTSDETTYAYRDLGVTVEQEGFEMSTTYVYSDEDVPEYGNDSLDLRPGVSIRCISEYNCKADGDTITYTIYNWYDEDEKIVVEFDPRNLPGRPAQDLEIQPVAEPQWTMSMSDEGTVGDARVLIDTAELVAGWDGDDVIRVYFDFTNEGEETESMWWMTNIRAFQDGVELKTAWPEEDVVEDENYNTDVEPGESLRCAQCWAIRSESPVEIEVYDSWAEEYVGCAFTF